jgi:hypothetical protein
MFVYIKSCQYSNFYTNCRFSSTNNFAYAQTLYRMSSLCRSYECMTIARVNIGVWTGWKVNNMQCNSPLPLCGDWVCFYWFHHVFPILSVILTEHHYNILTFSFFINFINAINYGNGMDEILMEIWRKHQAINQSKSKSGTWCDFFSNTIQLSPL